MEFFPRYLFFLFSSTIFFEGGDSRTVQTPASVTATVGSSVDLTCTYTLDPGDSVYSGLIAWKAKKSVSVDYEIIATFSPPGRGNNSFTTTESAMNLKDRAELLDVTSSGSNTFRVVMRVKEVQYLDEKEYQCSVTFTSTNTGPQTKTAVTSLTVQGGDGGTVLTSTSITATNGLSVDLTCTYTVGPGESVYSGPIVWQAKVSGTSDYENIATFLPPGGRNNYFTNTNSAMNLMNRTELLIVTSIGSDTSRAVMRVLEVQCLDEKEYRCYATFVTLNFGPQTETAVTSLTVQAPAETPYDIPVPEPSNIEENMKINLSCTANVGKPPGKIKWWRYRDQIYAPVLVAESSEIPAVQPGVCAYNVTFSIQPLITKDDDQSVWRCSVDNKLLTSFPDQDKPNQETARINVFYKVGVPKITKDPDSTNSQYYVGSSVTLTCVANGNPSPSTIIDKNINKYVWTFKANPGDNATELSSNNGVLSLNNLQQTDTGTYTCTAFNGFNGKVFNNSFEQGLKIVYRTATSASTEVSTEQIVTKDQQGGGRNGTVHTSASIKTTVGSSVDLTCQYTLGPDDSVYSGFIAWQAKISGSREYENIATFSPIGGGKNFFTTSASAMNLKDRSELLDITSTGPNTFRVVMRVKAVQHLDDKEYRCSVTFISPTTGPRTETAVTSLIVQKNHVTGRTKRHVSRGINRKKFHLFGNPRIFHSKAKIAGSSNLWHQ